MKSNTVEVASRQKGTMSETSARRTQLYRLRMSPTQKRIACQVATLFKAVLRSSVTPEEHKAILSRRRRSKRRHKLSRRQLLLKRLQQQHYSMQSRGFRPRRSVNAKLKKPESERSPRRVRHRLEPLMLPVTRVKHGPEPLMQPVTRVDRENERRLRRILVTDSLTARELSDHLTRCAREESRRNRDDRRRRYNDDDDNDNNDDDGDDGGNNNGGEESSIGSGNTFFDDRLKCDTKSRLLFYLNSGFFRFQQYKEYDASHDGEPIDVQAIKSEIHDESLTENEMRNLMANFLTNHSYTSERLASCGACGIRVLERIGSPSIRYKFAFLHSEYIGLPDLC